MTNSNAGNHEKLPASFPYAYDPTAPLTEMEQGFIDHLDELNPDLEATGNKRADAERAFENAIEYVYSVVGRGLYHVQTFELSLGNILLGTATTTGAVTTNDAAAELSKKIDRMPCGWVLGEAKQAMNINPHGLNILSRALTARNRFVHGFYERHASNMFNHDGRRAMVAEVVELIRILELADTMLEETTVVLLKRKGLTPAHRDAKFHAALHKGLTGEEPA